MPRFRKPTPSYLKHRQTGRARAVWTDALGVRHFRMLPGRHGSKESRTAFAKLELELAASPAGVVADPGDIVVMEVLNAYKDHAERTYRDPTTGKPSEELRQIKTCIRYARELYGDEPAAAFGPLALRAVREKFIGAGWSRKTVNARVERLKRMFRWAVAEELVGPEVYQKLAAVEGLRAGRTTAPDLPPVKPAVMKDVERILPKLTPTVRALVIVQLHSGARAGELVRLRVGDIDRTDPEAWIFKPGSHKTAWKQKSRTIYFGERCREALAPLILRAGGPEGFVFSPARSEDERNAKRSDERKTPLWPSHVANYERRLVGPKRKRKPRDHYTTGTYRRCLERACDLAGVPRFTPHRLRHLAATRVRAELGVDAARALLGHSLASVTEIYSSEVDRQLALKAVAKFG